jgi:acyl carrier protein
MSLEKSYGIQLTDEEYQKITTFTELSSVFYSAKQRGSYV